MVRAAQTVYGLVFYLWKTILPVRLSNLYEVPFRRIRGARPSSSPRSSSSLTGLSIALARRAPSFTAAWVSYVLPPSRVRARARRRTDRGGPHVPSVHPVGGPGGPRSPGSRHGSARDGAAASGLGAADDGSGPFSLGSAALSSARRRVLGPDAGPARFRDSVAARARAHPLGGRNGSLPGIGGARDPRGVARGAAGARRREYETRIKSLGERSAYWAICYNLAVAVREKGKIDEAIGLYARAVEMNPTNAELHNNWGAALNDLGRYGEAERRLGEAVRLDPRFAKAHYNLGIALAAQARAEEAVVEYRRAIDLDPQNADSHYNLGRLLADLGRLDEAASEYRRAIEARPAYPEALNNLGVVLSREGRLEDAAEAYRRALSIDPSHEGARRNLAQAMALIESGKR